MTTQQAQPGQYPAEHVPQAPAKPKRRTWPWVLGGFVAVIGVIAVSTGGGETPSTGGLAVPGEPAPAAASSGTLYEVTSDGATASVTYTVDENLNQAQENGVALPWSKTVDIDGGFMGGATLLAQAGQDAGTITCKISRDGEVLIENTSTGQFAVVTCSG